MVDIIEIHVKKIFLARNKLGVIYSCGGINSGHIITHAYGDFNAKKTGSAKNRFPCLGN